MICVCVFITLAAVKQQRRAGRQGYAFICVRDKEVSKRTEKKGDVIKFVHSSNLFDVMDEEKGLRMQHIFLGIEMVIGTILW